MNLALVGVGAAGGRIVEQIRSREQETGRTLSGGNVLVFDTADAEPDLSGIPYDQQITLGDVNPTVGEEGADGDVDLAASVVEEEHHDIRRVFDVFATHDLDGIAVVAGLGGGTGGGASVALVEVLRELFETPIYALGVLPGEADGDRAARNAARSLKSLVPLVDSTILVDNETWHSPDETAEAPYAETNREIATRVVSLFGTGEGDGSTVAENAVDASDIVRTLAPGGVSTIGYAATRLDGVPGSLLGRAIDLLRRDGDEPTIDPTELRGLVRKAVGSRLTLPCDVSSAERALLVVSGPPSRISRRGFERARYWLEEETDAVDVLAGDDPDPGSATLSVTVLLSNVTEVPWIDELQARAVAAGDDPPE